MWHNVDDVELFNCKLSWILGKISGEIGRYSCGLPSNMVLLKHFILLLEIGMAMNIIHFVNMCHFFVD